MSAEPTQPAADSAVEVGPGLLGPRDGGPTLRALGRVLGDLVDLGYVGGWHGLRAADVGAPHGRFRVFVVAHAQRQDRGGLGDVSGLGRGLDSCGDVPLLPTPRASDCDRGPRATGKDPRSLVDVGSLFPTPRATDGTKGGPNQRGSSGDLMLPSAVTLLPTPKASDGEWGLPRTSGRPPEKSTHLATALHFNQWGIYRPAVEAWEHILGRPAPAPTQPSKKGTPQLAPAFAEWMMGLPAGHVTDVPGLSRNDMLKAIGNGVVPAQAAAALRFLLSVERAA